MKNSLKAIIAAAVLTVNAVSLTACKKSKDDSDSTLAMTGSAVSGATQDSDTTQTTSEGLNPFDEQFVKMKYTGVSGYTGRLEFDDFNAPKEFQYHYYYINKDGERNGVIANGDEITIGMNAMKDYSESLVADVCSRFGYDKLACDEMKIVVDSVPEIPDELTEEQRKDLCTAFWDILMEQKKNDYPAVDKVYRYKKVLSVGEPEVFKQRYTVQKKDNYPKAMFSVIWRIPVQVECLDDYDNPIYNIDDKKGDVLDHYIFVQASGAPLRAKPDGSFLLDYDETDFRCSTTIGSDTSLNNYLEIKTLALPDIDIEY